MAQELSYVIINPYTLYKSRTGVILSRLLSQSSLELAAAAMYSPSADLVIEYSKMIVTENDPQDRQIQELIRDYVLENYMPNPLTGERQRVMVLLFKGENAVTKTREVVGNISHRSKGGETIRDTFGDLIFNRDGSVKYFEPAVLAPPSVEEAKAKLLLWKKYFDRDSGILSPILPTYNQPGHQRAVVILKPDNFRFPSGRPGYVIDMFSRTELAISAIKVHHMSVAEAEEFYAPVRIALQEKLKKPAATKAKELLESALGINIDSAREEELGRLVGPLYAEGQFNAIVQFMTGIDPKTCSPLQKKMPGKEKCIVLIYEGIDAVKKVREVLGPTDPAKAPPGSIRREFGQSIMINAAHASDSPENAEREIKILNMHQNNFVSIIQETYGS
ncbi:nucleoside-diphosphate kinase [Candidatus Methylacidiphilum infernorum]|uniref:Nucleoside diphosphate kinase n=1 Tax=Methylacidiphilum infernorum (isolate V4) TaxID=481448 RepID=B3DVR8_METI4|nr:nucleoside-diphosphate kinase [Candidatus Methylacidiphilum infernorum]ACD83421.1 Nucleoside diphosphate kinase [Methylacidiphilum infernorum V4]